MSAAQAAAIIVAAGRGERLGAAGPKALVELAGRSLLERSLRGLAASGRFSSFVVVVPPEAVKDPRWAEQAQTALGGDVPVELVSGGVRRRDSVEAGLARVTGTELVAVHDAARPLVTPEVVHRVLDAAAAHGAAVPGVPMSDTIFRERDGMLGEIVPRDELRAIQTPQAFRADLLAEAHRMAPGELDATDDAGLVHRLARPVAIVAGDPANEKITWQDDLVAAAARLRTDGGGSVGAAGDLEGQVNEHRGSGVGHQAVGGGHGLAGESEARVGLGWDVHPFEAGRPFVLAGVTVSEEFGPRGHSDGDPLAHAVADAMLGAVALGDIGTAFPDDDPRWKGVSGCEVLERTLAILRKSGWRPAQLDAVLVTDRPKIAPHREAIRESLAAVLGLPAGRVSVKGKRTEGLGGLAGGQGVSCQAIVAVERLPG